MVIDRWYEDDGVSGYIFDRPGFRQMMADLDKDIDTDVYKRQIKGQRIDNLFDFSFHG